jgi:glutathione synthase/RimK-type ligase-like ATP-grasp enzyme
MYVALLTSTGFDLNNQPLIRDAIVKRGHKYKAFEDIDIKGIDDLLEFDVIWDRSAITDDEFFKNLELKADKLQGKKPLLVNEPKAIMNSYDKIRTHTMIGEYSPRTIIYNGQNFDEIMDTFGKDQYVVVKEPRGWQAKGTNKIATSDLSILTLGKKPVLVQEYIEPRGGIYRALVICYDGKFEPISFYGRYPQNSWRTGVGSTSDIKQIFPSRSILKTVKTIAEKSGLFLNGIDYIPEGDKLYLLEVNSVPRLSTVTRMFGINAAGKCVENMEKMLEGN